MKPVYARPAKNIAKPISSGNALVGDVKKHPSAVGCATHAPEVCGDVEERSLDAEKCRVRDVELGLVSPDEEVVRRLERGQVLERLGRIGGVKPESVAVACGR
jgi:hypothetical protein